MNKTKIKASDIGLFGVILLMWMLLGLMFLPFVARADAATDREKADAMEEVLARYFLQDDKISFLAILTPANEQTIDVAMTLFNQTGLIEFPDQLTPIDCHAITFGLHVHLTQTLGMSEDLPLLGIDFDDPDVLQYYGILANHFISTNKAVTEQELNFHILFTNSLVPNFWGSKIRTEQNKIILDVLRTHGQHVQNIVNDILPILHSVNYFVETGVDPMEWRNEFGQSLTAFFDNDWTIPPNDDALPPGAWEPDPVTPPVPEPTPEPPASEDVWPEPTNPDLNTLKAINKQANLYPEIKFIFMEHTINQQPGKLEELRESLAIWLGVTLPLKPSFGVPEYVEAYYAHVPDALAKQLTLNDAYSHFAVSDRSWNGFKMLLKDMLTRTDYVDSPYDPVSPDIPAPIPEEPEPGSNGGSGGCNSFAYGLIAVVLILAYAVGKPWQNK
jgi:hypothetical protein